MVSRGHDIASSSEFSGKMPWQRLLHVKHNKFGRYGLVILFIIKLWTMWSTCKLKNFDISLNGKKQNDICRVNILELNICDKQLYLVIAKLLFLFAWCPAIKLITVEKNYLSTSLCIYVLEYILYWFNAQRQM